MKKIIFLLAINILCLFHNSCAQIDGAFLFPYIGKYLEISGGASTFASYNPRTKYDWGGQFTIRVPIVVTNNFMLSPFMGPEAMNTPSSLRGYDNSYFRYRFGLMGWHFYKIKKKQKNMRIYPLGEAAFNFIVGTFGKGTQGKNYIVFQSFTPSLGIGVGYKYRFLFIEVKYDLLFSKIYISPTLQRQLDRDNIEYTYPTKRLHNKLIDLSTVNVSLGISFPSLLKRKKFVLK